MSTIVTRSGKGSPLTHTEVDNNFTNLNTDKYQEGSAIGAVTPAAGTFTTLTATGTTNIGTTSLSTLPLNVLSGTNSNDKRGIAFWVNVTASPYARLNVPSGSGGALGLFTSDGSYEPTEQFRVSRGGSSTVNYVQVTGAATGGQVNISSQGSDSAVPLALNTKGVTVIRLQSNNANVMRLNGIASAANYIDVFASIAGAAPSIQSQGSDTNIDLTLTPKGTGKVIVGGSGGLRVNRIDSSNEGGQLDLCRSSDNASAWAIDVYGSTSTPSLRFIDNTAAATRMSIDSSGNLLVGTTSGSNRLTVSSAVNDYISRMYNTNATGADMLYMQSTADPNNSTYKFIYTYSGAAVRFSVSSNGGISNYSANNVNLSDRREKTNFAPAKSYLDVICAIPVQTYNYIDQNMEEDGGLTLGVVAQDVQAVAPELVTESNWGTDEEPKMRLSIYQTDMQYALMKCIQEQQAQIEQLTMRLSALEN